MGNTATKDVEEVAFNCVKDKKGDQKLKQLIQGKNLTREQLKDLFEARDIEGRSLLMVACTAGNANVVQFLIQNGAPVTQRSEKGFTPLHYACQLKNERNAESIITVLLSANEDPIVRDKLKRTPFHLLQLSNQVDLLRKLESRVCDFVGNLKIERSSSLQNGLGAFLGDNVKKSMIEQFGSKWKTRWVVITRLRGSLAMAKYPRMRCPKCLAFQEEVTKAKVHITCRCGQLLIVPPPQRPIQNCITIYSHPSATIPDAVYDLTDAKVEMQLKHGQNIVVVTFDEKSATAIDPAYVQKPKILEHFRTSQRRFAVQDLLTLRLTSINQVSTQMAFNALSRKVRVWPEPISDTQQAPSPPPPPPPPQQQHRINHIEVPLAIAVDPEANDYGFSYAPPSERFSNGRESNISEGNSNTVQMPPLPPRPRQPVTAWNCSKCTYTNSVSPNACEMCDEPRSRRESHQMVKCPSAPSAPSEVEVENASITAATTASIRDSAIDPKRARGSTEHEPFFCPITNLVMKDPVSTSDGNTYERSAIEEWFKSGKNTSPVSGEELENLSLVPNIALRKLIDQALSKGLIPAVKSDIQTSSLVC